MERPAPLGDRVNVLPGARIGREGFGFAQTDEGFLTLPQLGRVILEDDAEVGASSTVDRGSTQATVRRRGRGRQLRIDELGDFAVIAAQAGLTGHLNTGKGARTGAQAGVMGNMAAGAEIVGSPVGPVRESCRGVATLRKLARRPKTADKQSAD